MGSPVQFGFRSRKSGSSAGDVIFTNRTVTRRALLAWVALYDGQWALHSCLTCLLVSLQDASPNAQNPGSRALGTVPPQTNPLLIAGSYMRVFLPPARTGPTPSASVAAEVSPMHLFYAAPRPTL